MSASLAGVDAKEGVAKEGVRGGTYTEGRKSVRFFFFINRGQGIRKLVSVRMAGGGPWKKEAHRQALGARGGR